MAIKHVTNKNFLKLLPTPQVLINAIVLYYTWLLDEPAADEGAMDVILCVAR